MSRGQVLLFLLNQDFLCHFHQYYLEINSYHHLWSLNNRNQPHHKKRGLIYHLIFLFKSILSYLLIVAYPSMSSSLLSLFVLILHSSISPQTISQVWATLLLILLFQTWDSQGFQALAFLPPDFFFLLRSLLCRPRFLQEKGCYLMGYFILLILIVFVFPFIGKFKLMFFF